MSQIIELVDKPSKTTPHKHAKMSTKVEENMTMTGNDKKDAFWTQSGKISSMMIVGAVGVVTFDIAP